MAHIFTGLARLSLYFHVHEHRLYKAFSECIEHAAPALKELDLAFPNQYLELERIQLIDLLSQYQPDNNDKIDFPKLGRLFISGMMINGTIFIHVLQALAALQCIDTHRCRLIKDTEDYTWHMFGSELPEHINTWRLYELGAPLQNNFKQDSLPEG